MTAPSLLDELEGVVRLAEKATPGPFVVDGYGDVTANGEDVARIASDGYSAYHDAHLFADAANFIRAHHAEIADMAKRLEAADKLLRDIAGRQWFSREAPATVELIDAHLQANAATQKGEG